MARASGYDAGSRMTICMCCSSMGMPAVISRAEGETLMVRGGSEVDCEGAHSLMVLSSEAMIWGEI